jgi:hypothetical protein
LLPNDLNETPNGMRISRAAAIDSNSIIPETDAKIGTILGPRSGVGLHARVGWQAGSSVLLLERLAGFVAM